jgi:hypothetical protein
MDKKDAFKSFAKTHPELINSIKSGDTSWQKLYEIYDIYGEDDRAWNTYFNKSANTSNSSSFGGITDIVKNIDMESVQKHINTAQKALGLVQELTGKGVSAGEIKTPVTPRPINKFFED